MNPAILTYALQLLGVLPSLIEAGASVVDLVQNGKAKIQQMQDENRGPTDEEWAALNDSIAKKRADLHG